MGGDGVIDNLTIQGNISESHDEQLLPSVFELSQNYPNPFNPTTIIKYSLPQRSSVTLKVFDALGKEISTLINNEQSAGNYTITYKAESLASGIYFYTIRANKFIKTRKMLLIK